MARLYGMSEYEEQKAKQETVLRQLSALSLANYRRSRWATIDRARKLGLEWAEVGDALGMDRTAAARIYRTDAPQD